MRIILPILLAAIILASIGWYLFVYDRGFTRDMLLQQARFHDLHGNSRMSSWYYDMAYNFSGRDANVAIELANQYKQDGNYTKAESTLTNAIKQSGTAELYTALSRTYAEQDKLMDSVSLLNKIQDPQLKAQIDAIRPAAPTPDMAPGFYSQYIDVSLSGAGTIYCRTDGEYPTTADTPYADPIHLGTGETEIRAVTISPDGLVSEEAVLSYTVGGVIEPVTLKDPAIDREIRNILKVDAGTQLYSNDLWKIEEFTVPKDATQFTDLKQITYLAKLTISGFEIKDLTFLHDFTQLKILDLTGCHVAPESLEGLAPLPALEDLILGETGLSSIAGLKDVRGLKKLDLRNNTIRNIEVLSGMANLEEVNLSHNALIDLTALGSLKELSRLDISFNAVKDLSPLADCIKLAHLEAGNNQISSLSGVAGLTLLSYLDVEHNSISDISVLENSTQMVTLKMSSNDISDLSALANMTLLDGLYFANNSVEALPEWPDGGNLRIIDGSHNLIESLEGLRHMDQLAYVYLDYNAITDIEPISGCYKLVQVNIYGNEIEDVSALTEQDIIVNYDPT